MDKDIIEKIAGAICKARITVNGHTDEVVCPLICPWCQAIAESSIKTIKDAGYTVVSTDRIDHLEEVKAMFIELDKRVMWEGLGLGNTTAEKIERLLQDENNDQTRLVTCPQGV